MNVSKAVNHRPYIILSAETTLDGRSGSQYSRNLDGEYLCLRKFNVELALSNKAQMHFTFQYSSRFCASCHAVSVFQRGYVGHFLE